MQSGITEVVLSSHQAGDYHRPISGLTLLVTMIGCSGATKELAGDKITVVNRATAKPDHDTGVKAGARRFEHGCAICHGFDARSNRPFAELLNIHPSDLTRLPRAAGGDFPFGPVYQRIDGRQLPFTHGTPAMPSGDSV